MIIRTFYYLPDILHLSDTGEKVVVKWDSTSAVYRLGNKACGAVRREVLHNILIEFGIPIKLVMVI
jgi:hypothetical protein